MLLCLNSSATAIRLPVVGKLIPPNFNPTDVTNELTTGLTGAQYVLIAANTNFFFIWSSGYAEIATPGLLCSVVPVVSGLTTTGLGAGDFGYVSAANTISKTDATVSASSKLFGANLGVVGSMATAGLITYAKFTTAGGSPANGASVYLALGTDDGATGSGKLTATAPVTVGQFVAEVGLCVDNGNYASLKIAKVLLQPKTVIAL